MLKSIKQHIDRDEEEGFTLIELMVVVLIIGILMAIAIPTFLGAKNTANARATQSNLRNAITAEQSYFTNNNQTYGAATAVSASEPALTWSVLNPAVVAPASLKGNSVGVVPGTDSAGAATVEVGALGNDGNAYYIYDDNGVVSYLTVVGNSAAPAAATTPVAANTNSKMGWSATW